MDLPGTKLIDALYSDRENFAIVGLTGYANSGCTRLSDLMCKDFKDWEGLRKPEDLKVVRPKHLYNDDLMFSDSNNQDCISSNVFARKYSICHDFIKEKYSPFTRLKYSKALLFYILRYLVMQPSKDSVEELTKKISVILEEKFRPQSSIAEEYYKIVPYDSIRLEIERLNVNWEELHKEISDTFGPNFKNIRLEMARSFFNPESTFNNFATTLTEEMWRKDAYCTAMFFHRLGFVIRATGNPMTKSKEVVDSGKIYSENLYVVVELINDLIKGFKELEHPDSIHRRIVIDKIRNSLEAKFLKERFSAFYLIAVHDDLHPGKHLISRLKSRYPTQEEIDKSEDVIKMQAKSIFHIDAIEREGKDFESGKFFAPNLSQCVADAEIHISNTTEPGGDKPVFYTMSEQWMKYAALMLHPGLITPSSEERCMVVAYTAKFNSGCLSRQVGAVITNKAHTIRTIGWNDVPYGQMPCSLRELNVMAHDKNDVVGTRQYIYSDYERNEAKTYGDKSFVGSVRLKYRNLHIDGGKNALMHGFPYSYCFKSLQNSFEGIKNQVHTRSLHAEENAILQMAKYGGEALNGGVIYVTASPCELCCKKLYQIGVRKIVYIDEYPGISRENIINNGYHRPRLKQFQGAYGATYFKLFQPIIPYKEELNLRNLTEAQPKKSLISDGTKLKCLSEALGVDLTIDIQNENDLKALMDEALTRKAEHNEKK